MRLCFEVCMPGVWQQGGAGKSGIFGSADLIRNAVKTLNRFACHLAAALHTSALYMHFCLPVLATHLPVLKLL
jgi:hypothetical protein